MNSTFETLWKLIEIPIVLAFIILGYLLLCTPGILLIKLIQRYRQPTMKNEALILAAIRSIFMAPVPVFAHGILILPFPFGFLAYALDIGMKISVLWLIIPLPVVFISSIAYSALKK